ncbi:GTPase-activating protein RGA2 [Saccharomyces eubayanus]|uniref:GTPase-activating protein RGA2 n=1 Tax=Saccharomyces eubayanus TaxID=1080349 RepID=UPI0006C60569|nr:RGA2-like protein [Saccharomyces eubayanus]KOH01199.1 RGA2-like protein [Saccharomyces eubayanus]
MSADSTINQSASCVRCDKSIASSQVYELENKKWHDRCFTCYKCDKQLNADSDFLVLDTGTLICYDCSDKCTSCGNKIDDTAIILPSSNEPYCANCFKCCKCDKHIKNLKYAKTKRGLCCMDCHDKLIRKKNLLLGKQTRDSFRDNIPIALPQRSANRPLSPTRDNDKPSISANDFVVHENTTGSNEGKQVTPQVLVSQETDDTFSSSNDNDNDDSNDKQEKSSHARTISIDDILNSTLEHDSNSIEEQSLTDNEDYISRIAGNVSYRLLQPHKPNKDSIIVKEPKTPNSNSNANRFVSIYDKEEVDRDGTDNKENDVVISTPRNSNEKITSPLNSPMAVQAEEDLDQFHGLALSLPNVYKESNRSFQNTQTSKPTNQVSSLARSSTLEIKPSASSSTLRVSNSGNFSRPQTTDNSQSHNKIAPPANKKLSRSFSLKSKTFVHNLKSKTSEILDPKHPHNTTPVQESDTHSGWGVSSAHTTSARKSKIKKIPVSRGQSDSTVYKSVAQNEKPIAADSSHKKAQSSLGGIPKKQVPNDLVANRRINGSYPSASSGHHIAMFRTPPLESTPLFNRPSISSDSAHHRSSSLQTSRSTNTLLEDDSTNVDATDEQTTSLERDYYVTELTLRKLKSDVRELEGTKKKLLQDVESLKQMKERLSNDVVYLTREKDKQSVSSKESLEQKSNNGTTIIVKSPSANIDRKGSISNASPKPRFWKLFSSGSKDHQSEELDPQHSPNSSFSGGTSIAQKEISTPRLIRAHDGLQSPSKLSPSPSPKKSDIVYDGSHLYGSTLVARCAFEKCTVPMIIKCCIKYIEADDVGLNMEGLYRKSGSQTLIEDIEKEFAQNTPLHTDKVSSKLNNLLHQDVHAVASVLKRYLRKLPDPVLPFSIYDSLVDLVRSNQLVERLPLSKNGPAESSQKSSIYDTVVRNLNEILKSLPLEHYEVLKVLATHINKVQRYSEWNLMNLHNLSLVFAPSLIHDLDGEKDIVDMKERNYIVEFILGNYRDIFTLA